MKSEIWEEARKKVKRKNCRTQIVEKKEVYDLNILLIQISLSVSLDLQALLSQTICQTKNLEKYIGGTEINLGAHSTDLV